mmetsp:Transcript_15515/g.31839  ORF Transcript_15515/g.31839 Transcript_15515/m.31839 type:complete len:587 (+) Transcript_15515:2844-4604(+)
MGFLLGKAGDVGHPGVPFVDLPDNVDTEYGSVGRVDELPELQCHTRHGPIPLDGFSHVLGDDHHSHHLVVHVALGGDVHQKVPDLVGFRAELELVVGRSLSVVQGLFEDGPDGISNVRENKGVHQQTTKGVLFSVSGDFCGLVVPFVDVSIGIDPKNRSVGGIDQFSQFVGRGLDGQKFGETLGHVASDKNRTHDLHLCVVPRGSVRNDVPGFVPWWLLFLLLLFLSVVGVVGCRARLLLFFSRGIVGGAAFAAVLDRQMELRCRSAPAGLRQDRCKGFAEQGWCRTVHRGACRSDGQESGIVQKRTSHRGFLGNARKVFHLVVPFVDPSGSIHTEQDGIDGFEERAIVLVLVVLVAVCIVVGIGMTRWCWWCFVHRQPRFLELAQRGCWYLAKELAAVFDCCRGGPVRGGRHRRRGDRRGRGRQRYRGHHRRGLVGFCFLQQQRRAFGHGRQDAAFRRHANGMGNADQGPGRCLKGEGGRNKRRSTVVVVVVAAVVVVLPAGGHPSGALGMVVANHKDYPGHSSFAAAVVVCCWSPVLLARNNTKLELWQQIYHEFLCGSRRYPRIVSGSHFVAGSFPPGDARSF